jgi:hypothetical protein
MSAEATRLHAALSMAYELANYKRMEIAACLFNPARLHRSVSNAKRLAALVAELVELTAKGAQLEAEYYRALDK